MKKYFIVLIAVLFYVTPATAAGYWGAAKGAIITDTSGLELVLEPNGSMPVTLQDQTSPIFIIHAAQVTNATTLTTQAEIDDYELVVTSAVGINIGDYIGVFNNATERYYVGHVIDINSNTLSLDSPVDSVLAVGDIVGTGSTNMAVDGSGTRQIFTVRGADPGVDITLDIVRIIITCITATATAFDEFGDITALTRGLVIRRVDGTTHNIVNWKSNIGMMGTMYDWQSLEAKNPSQGAFGFAGRITFGGQSKMGAVIRIAAGESLEFIVQDDLRGLVSLECVVEGSEVVNGGN
jgi:hypothetical protein